MNRLPVGLIGARGYVGQELVTLLSRHPGFELALINARGQQGRPARDLFPSAPLGLALEDLTPEAAAARGLAFYVLALPNGAASQWTDALAAGNPAAGLVDLSADHRFDPAWTYGLPEHNRAAIRGARRIANPGCYATGMQVALRPLLDALDGTPTAFGISGYSGAGTTPSPKNDPARLADNLIPYSLVSHIHQREVSAKLGRPVRFLPHVSPVFRGITLTLSGGLKAGETQGSLWARYQAAYGDEPLVRLSEEAPELRDAAGRHGVSVGGLTVSPDGLSFAVVATLDNLLKGAATQALQNLNLMAGHPELAGLEAPWG